MKSDSPTLQDVAQKASVSTATISRAINEPEKVAASTLGRIRQVINELGYTPNFGGKVLASKRSNTVGAIIPTMTNALFAAGLQAFQEALAEAGVTLLVASSGYSPDNELEQIRSLVAHGADGLLLIGASRPQSTIDFLNIRNIPHVIAWHFEEDSSRLFAGFDNKKAARDVTRLVLKKGHQKIALIAGIAEGNDRAKRRIDGVKTAIKESNRGAVLLETIETGYSLENGGDALEKLVALKDKPTAIICGNDVLAAGACIRARELGYAVPKDFSITGFDDISLATAVSPALTTVRVPHTAMGKGAAKLLLELLTTGSAPQSIEFATEIIERESLTGPASA